MSAPSHHATSSALTAAETPDEGVRRRLRPDLPQLLVAALCLAGAGLRLTHFAGRRSLWLDEAMLSLNIAGRSYGDLGRALDYGQTAPLLFLWVERAVVQLLGVNELTLRAFPLAAGIILLPVMWRLAQRVLSRDGAVLAVAVTAFSPALVYYANEVKPYGIDALVTALLVWGALAVIARPTQARVWWALGLGGAVAIWASTPSVFVLAGAGLALLTARGVRHARRFWWRFAAVAGAWAGSFAVAFLAYYCAAGQNAYMQRFWNGMFLDVPPPALFGRLFRGLGATLIATFYREQLFLYRQHSFFPPNPSVGTIAAVSIAGAVCTLGITVLVRRHGLSMAALLVGPVAAACAASALRQYPIASRLMTYAAPLLILAAAAGLSWLAARAARWARMSGWSLGRRASPAPAAAALGLLFLVTSVAETREQLREPTHAVPVRLLIDSLRRHRASSEPVYVSPRALAQWVYYTTDWSAPDTARLRFAANAGRPPEGRSFYNKLWLGSAIVGEGSDLVYRTPAGLELYGISNRLREREPRSDFTDRDWGGPAPGWAGNEVVRIRREARPCAWLFVVYGPAERPAILRGSVEWSAILQQLEAAGARRTHHFTNSNADVLRVCFATRAP